MEEINNKNFFPRITDFYKMRDYNLKLTSEENGFIALKLYS